MAEDVLASLKIAIEASLKDFNAKMGEFEEVLKGTEENTRHTASSFGEMTSAMALGQLAAEAIKKALSELKEIAIGGMKAFDDEAMAMLRLRSSIGEGADAVKKYAEEQEKITRFTQKDTITAADSLAIHKLNREEILKLLPVIEDFATKKGTTATATAEAFGRAIEYGTTRGLRPFGIEVEKNGSQLSIYNDLLDAGNGKVKGLAEQAGKTALGPLQEFDNQINNIKKSFGEQLIPVLNSFLKSDGPQLLLLATNLAKNILNIVKAIDAMWTMTSGRRGDWEKGWAMLTAPEQGTTPEDKEAAARKAMFPGGLKPGGETSNLGTTPLGGKDTAGIEFWKKQHELILSNLSVYTKQAEAAIRELNEKMKAGEIGLAEWYEKTKAEIAKSGSEQIAVQKEIIRTTDDANEKAQATNKLAEIEIENKQKQTDLSRQYKTALEAEGKAKVEIQKLLDQAQGKIAEMEAPGLYDPVAQMRRQHEQQLAEARDCFAKLAEMKIKDADESKRRDELAAQKSIAIRKLEEKQSIEIAIAEKKARMEIAEHISSGLRDIMWGLYEETGKRSEEMFNLWKASAIAQAVVTTAASAVTAYNEGLQAGGEAGPAVGAIYAAIAIAAGAVEIAKISSTQMKRAETGGYLRGPSHANGGVVINAEGGEYIHSKAAVNTYGTSAMDAINRGLIPPSVLHSYTRGGASPGGAGATIHITNLVDPRQIDRHLATAEGKSSMLNFIGQNKSEIRAKIGV